MMVLARSTARAIVRRRAIAVLRHAATRCGSTDAMSFARAGALRSIHSVVETASFTPVIRLIIRHPIVRLRQGPPQLWTWHATSPHSRRAAAGSECVIGRQVTHLVTDHVTLPVFCIPRHLTNQF